LDGTAALEFRRTPRGGPKRTAGLLRSKYARLGFFCFAGKYSHEEFSNESSRERSARTVDCSHKIGGAIRCESLQAFKQCSESHDASSDHQRPGPSEADKCRDYEIAKEVVELPTEPDARLPVLRAGSGQRRWTILRKNASMDERDLNYR
jgi:hypothetical protein